MKKLSGIALLLILCLLITGCSKESMFESELHAVNVKSGNKTTKPYMISLSGSGSIRNSVSGLASVMGKFQGEMTISEEITNSDGTTTIITNDFLRAANGDFLFTSSELIFTLSGSTNDGDGQTLTYTYTGTSTITGGTGRFEGATGVFNLFDGNYVFKVPFEIISPRIAEFSHQGKGTITF